MKKAILFLALVLALNAVAPVANFLVSDVYAKHTDDHDPRDQE